MRRSAAEILFRLGQEAANFRLYLKPPREVPRISPLPLPAPEAIAGRLRGTRFSEQVQQIAESCTAHRIPLLGYEIQPGRAIRWRRDAVHDVETPAIYFRRIPYLDFKSSGDHKIVWELNRHQHLVAMAQASLLSGRADFRDEIWRQLESWLDQNPVCTGINWASALEVAFRALSWIWIHHLAGGRMPAVLAERWRRALYHHGCYLERNLSIYFSPNTHLQGEALALHALGMLFGVERWRNRGSTLMRRMMAEHVNSDGGHFEQSSYYHLYATDMFLFHAVLERPPEAYLESLRRMARYLWALAGSGEMPMLGDDDGGRLFYPFGERRRFARATLAACAAFLGDTPSHGDSEDLEELALWWLGERARVGQNAARASEFFPHTGVAVMVEEDTEIIASARAFGRGSAGHSHAHALQFVLRRSGQAVLIDPGTYTYISDPLWRGRFRGTAAHNTVRVDGLDQADPAGPFRWSNPPSTEVLGWEPSPWRLHARCRYREICHERRIIFSQGAIWVVDDILGDGRHRIEQFWHTPDLVERLPDGSVRLSGGIRMLAADGYRIDVEEGGDYGWQSPVFGVKRPCHALCVSIEANLPLRMAAIFDSHEVSGPLRIEKDRLTLGDRQVPIG